MRTDQLRQRLWISLKLTGRRWRWRAWRLVQWIGVASILGAAFLIFRPFVPDLHTVGPARSALPEVYFIQDPFGNILLLFIGMVMVWWPSRPTA